MYFEGVVVGVGDIDGEDKAQRCTDGIGVEDVYDTFSKNGGNLTPTVLSGTG